MSENTQIQQLLAALPEMFPGVQKIPLANIRLNPDNPGASPTQEDIDELAANIALLGLKNEIKVMPDPAGPLAPGLIPHPDNPRLKLAVSSNETAQPKSGPQLEASAQVDGTPWTLSDFRFLNLSGELRQLACQNLQWTEIDGKILNPPPEMLAEIIWTDNVVRNKGWWAAYQSIEAVIKTNPHLTQKEVATRLRMNVESVNWALRLLPLLNTEARGVLIRNPNLKNKDIWGISESAAFRLTALGPGTGLKRGGGPNDPPQALYPYPSIPPETQDLVYRTLVTACDQQMTEAQVAKLVEKAKTGHPADLSQLGESSPEPAKHTHKPQPSSAKEHPVSATPSAAPTAETVAGKVAVSPHPSANNALGQPSPVAEASLPGAHKAPGQSTHAPQPVVSEQTQVPPSHSAPASTPEHTAAQPTQGPSLLLELLAGVSIIGQIKSKIKKKEKVTWGEMLLVIGHDVGRGLGWVIKHTYKLFKTIFKMVWKVLKHGTKAVTKLFGPWFYSAFNTAMPIILLIGLGYLAWDVYEHGATSHPVRFIESQAEQGLSRWKDSIFHPSADNAPAVTGTSNTASAPVTPVTVVTAVPTPLAVTNHPVNNTPVALPQKQASPHPSTNNALGQPSPVARPDASQQVDAGISSLAETQQPTHAPLVSNPAPVVSASNSGSVSNTTTISAIATIQPTPTAHTDVVGQAAASAVKQVGTDAAINTVRHLLPF